MRDYVDGQIRSGAYANLSEVVRAGIRLLMERDGARKFYALKAELEHAACLAKPIGRGQMCGRLGMVPPPEVKTQVWVQAGHSHVRGFWIPCPEWGQDHQ